MLICECPMCDAEINLRGYKENQMIKCPECGAKLEIVSLTPPVVEEPLRDDDDWDDEEDWDDKDDDDWDDKAGEDWDDWDELE